MPQENNTAKYIPGKCNLGKAEVNRRYRIGFIGLIASIAFIVLFEIINPNPAWKLLLFIPVFYALSGFIQAKKKFCYFYGIKHVYSTEGIKTFTPVNNDPYREKDTRTAYNILSLTFLGSVIITFLYFSLT